MLTVILFLGTIVSILLYIVPSVLYFLNRNKTNFSKEIKIISIIYILVIIRWVMQIVTSQKIVSSPNSFLDAVFQIVGISFLLFIAWKMKDGAGFKSLFKNPGINKILFAIYIVANVILALTLFIIIINYLIIGALAIALLWVVNIFLGGGLGIDSAGENSATAYASCSSCSRFIDSKCAESPSAMISNPDNYKCGQYQRGSK